MLTPEDTFEGNGTGYIGLYRDFPTHWRIIKAIKERKPSNVLDVAGARGYICKHLEAEMGIRAVCMDISDHCLHTRATDSFVLHDARKAPWPFKDKEFDLAISMAFMEHLTEEEIPTVIKEMARVSQRAYLTITFEKTPQDTDKTHKTFEPWEAWMAKFKEYAPDYPVEIMTAEEAKKMEQTPIELPQADGLVKVNVGCFLDMFYGWKNLDSQNLSDFAMQNGYMFKQVDVKSGMPYLDSSVDLILASHFLEHLNREEGEKFLKECLRVLKSDGLIRLVIPDSKLLAQKYLKGKIVEYRHVNIGVENAPDDAEAFFHLLLAGHQTIYDYPSLKNLLEKGGFQNVKQMSAWKSQSTVIQKQTIPMYPTLSLYLEAIKPRIELTPKTKSRTEVKTDSKLKIGLISTPFIRTPPIRYGGLESVIADLGEMLAKLGHDVTIFASDESFAEGCKIVPFGPALEKVQIDWLQAERQAYEKIKDLLQDFDIIHGMNWLGFEYLAKSRNPKLHVCHTHHGGASSDWWCRSKPPFKLNFIAISKWMQQVYAQQGITSRFVYNGINLDKYPYSENHGDRFLFLSRISSFKAPHVAIAVAKKAGVELDVAGATNFVDNPAYVEQVKSACDGKQIRFVGEVTHEEKLKLLQNARGLIVPGVWKEPFGLHVIEALAVGCPVVAFRDGGIVETMQDGVSGFLCDDEDGMAKAILQLRDINRKACRERVEKHFAREKMACNYLNLYYDILSGTEW